MMITNPFPLVGIGLGVLLILIYVAVTMRHAQRATELSDAVTLFLSSAGISAGAKVLYIAVSPALTAIENERIYVFLGGLSVIWVSIQTIAKTLRL